MRYTPQKPSKKISVHERLVRQFDGLALVEQNGHYLIKSFNGGLTVYRGVDAKADSLELLALVEAGA